MDAHRPDPDRPTDRLDGADELEEEAGDTGDAKEQQAAALLPLGIGVGTALGVVIGVAIDNIGLGLGIGVALGSAGSAVAISLVSRRTSR